MAQKRDLIMLEPEAARALPELKGARQIEASFPKRAVSAADFKKAQVSWTKSVKEPDVKQPAPRPIKGVRLTADHVEVLRAIHESTAPTAEMIGQQAGPEQVLGILHSSLTAFEYTRMKSEFKQRLSEAKDKKVVQEQWQQVVAAAEAAHAAAGLKDVKEADLDAMATELGRKKAGFNAVATIANSAKAVAPSNVRQALGNFVTQAGVEADLVAIVTTFQTTVCTKPIQGNFTKHFSKSFALQVTLTVWCPTWTNPFRTCDKTFTLAGVSFSVDLSVGYRITCCGAAAGGQAAAQVCATIIGISVCASCTASITAVVGTGKTGSGSSCLYGLGLNAELKCQFAGITLFDINVPFGWTISGPCLPPC